MNQRTTAEQADFLSRRRARMLPLLAAIYPTQQASFFLAGDGDRTVDHVKVGAWLLLSLVLLAAVEPESLGRQRREVRDMIDDEVTRAHRGDALGWGFIVSTLTGIALYFVAMIEPVTPREVIHLIVSLGLGAAIIRFGMLEMRAIKDD